MLICELESWNPQTWSVLEFQEKLSKIQRQIENDSIKSNI